MKIKKKWIIAVGALVLLGIILLFLRGSEDSWIKDSKGIWTKHGNPAETPNYVLEQQDAINCTAGKFLEFSGEINSQCLGNCGDYAVDIVHVPRVEEDSKEENQCENYLTGNVKHFIEIDKEGTIVRIL